MSRKFFAFLLLTFLGGILIGTRFASPGPAKPNPGHSWAEIECDTNLCVNTANQRVGIGTTSPQAKLHISGAGNSDDIRLTDASPQIKFEDTTAGHTKWWIHANNDRLYFLPDADENGAWETPYPLVLYAVSTSDKRVGINQATPAYTLDVSGTGRFTGNLYASGTIKSNTNIKVDLTGKSGSAGRDAYYITISDDNDRGVFLCSREGSAVCEGFFFWSIDGKKAASLRARYFEADCPSGYVAVGDFCIQKYEAGIARWFDAVKYCAQVGAHLCTAAEWVAAAQLASGSLNDMFDDDEWVADACGEAKYITLDYYSGTAHISCESEFNYNAYRCCIPRKIGR